MNEWMLRSACGPDDADLFDDCWPRGRPSHEHIDQTETARALCQSCPVLAECRTWALDALPYMFAGGMTAAERSAERKNRRRRDGYTRVSPRTRVG